MNFLRRIPAFVTGLFILVALIVGFNSTNQLYREYVPASTLFEARVQVPDFKAGENPLVVYDRTIHQDLIGSFHVEVKDAASGATVCSGGASNILYEAGEKLDPSIANFDWFVGAKCSLEVKAGHQYTLETAWTLRVENWPTKLITNRSNIFQVT